MIHLENLLFTVNIAVPDSAKLEECLHSIIFEQRQLSSDAAGTTLSSIRLQQRIMVLHRYLTALAHHMPTKARSPVRKKQNLQANLSKQKRLAPADNPLIMFAVILNMSLSVHVVFYFKYGKFRMKKRFIDLYFVNCSRFELAGILKKIVKAFQVVIWFIELF